MSPSCTRAATARWGVRGAEGVPHPGPRYGPLLLAAGGAALLVAEALHAHPAAEHAHGGATAHVPAEWAGVVLVIAASAWNAWPRRRGPRPACGGSVEGAC